MLTSTRRRAAGRAVDPAWPPAASTRFDDAVEAAAGEDPRAADAVVLDARPQRAAVAEPHDDAALGAAGVLRGVGERLGDREVRGRLGVAAAASVEPHVEVHRDDRAGGERRERRIEPAIVEDGGVDAAGQLAKLGDRRLRRGVSLVDQRLRGLPDRCRSSAARAPASCRPRRVAAGRRRADHARCACARHRPRGRLRRAGRWRCGPPRRAALRGRAPRWPGRERRAGWRGRRSRRARGQPRGCRPGQPTRRGPSSPVRGDPQAVARGVQRRERHRDPGGEDAQEQHDPAEDRRDRERWRCAPHRRVDRAAATSAQPAAEARAWPSGAACAAEGRTRTVRRRAPSRATPRRTGRRRRRRGAADADAEDGKEAESEAEQGEEDREDGRTDDAERGELGSRAQDAQRRGDVHRSRGRQGGRRGRRGEGSA